jgi:tetratricopeptide (TPR) repeat protein
VSAFVLALVLAIGAPPAHAADVASALANAVANPVDPQRRLHLGIALAGTVGREEDAVDVLRAMLPHPTARDVLADLLARNAARPGWADLYARLGADSEVTRRDVLRVRAAELSGRSAKARSRAVASLSALAVAGEPREAGWALLRLGEASAAAVAFSRAGDDAGSRTGLAMARLGMGALAAAVATGMLPGTGLDATRAEVSRLLLDAGLPRLAMAQLEGRLDLAGARARAAASEAAQEHGASAKAWRRVIELEPGASDAPHGLAEALAAQWRFDEAAEVVEEVAPALAKAYRAAHVVAMARRSTSTADDRPAAVEAFALAPDAPESKAAWGIALLREKKPAEAVPYLVQASLDLPGDMWVVGHLEQAAIEAKVPSAAMDAVAVAEAMAPTPKQRAAMATELRNLRVLAGEARKAAAESAKGIEPYVLAVAMTPGDIPVLAGAAGIFWQDGRNDAAFALFQAALALAPQDPDLVVPAVNLAIAAGRESEAAAFLAAAKGNDPRLVLLRLNLQQALISRDARAALRAGDLAKAEAAYRALLKQDPDQSDFLRGLGDALYGLGNIDEALTMYRRALSGNAKDAFAIIGEANCLLELGQPSAVRARLEDFPEDAPEATKKLRQVVFAASWRATGDELRQAGSDVAAFDAYQASIEYFPEAWALIGLAALYLSHAQPNVAEAFYAEALSLDPGNPTAMAGHAIALEQMGDEDAAIREANALLAAVPGEESEALRVGVLTRIAVIRGEYFRRSGKPAEAVAVLEDTIRRVESADAWAALGAARLELDDNRGAAEAVAAAIRLDPENAWARGVALEAGRRLAASRSMLPLFERAASTGDRDARWDLDEARLDAEIQDADAFAREGRIDEAAAALRRADRLARDPDAFVRVGGGWLRIRRANEASADFDRALGADPGHVDATLGVAGAYRLQGHLRAAQRYLQGKWNEDASLHIGLELVRVMLQRDMFVLAERTLDEVRAHPAPSPPVKERPPTVVPEPLPVLELPSGRAIRPMIVRPPPPPPPPPPPAWIAVTIAELQERLEIETSARAELGVGIKSRPGDTGSSRMEAFYVTAMGGPAPIGIYRFDLEATPTAISDGEHEDVGVGASVGVATADERQFFGTARVGVSPIGFEGGVYPTWSLHGRAGVGPSLALGMATARTPVAHSVLSWAGLVDPATGQAFGRVSMLYLAGYASYTPPSRWDVGAQVRGGWTEGLGVAINPYVDGVAWLGRTIGSPTAALRVGADGSAQHHDRQADEFVPSQGGYFSPPLYASANLRADGRVGLSAGKARICADASAGVQHIEGNQTDQFGPTTGGLFGARLGAALRPHPRWSASIDGRLQFTSTLWHQEAAYLRVTYGLDRRPETAPGLATFASPGTLFASNNPCSPDSP